MTATDYSPQQLAAIRSQADVTICVACPGSGKTRTLVGWLRQQIIDGTPAARVAAVTFTCAAAKVLVERVGQQIGFAGTLHAFLYRLLCQHHALIGLGERPGIVDAEAAEQILEEVKAEHRYRGMAAALEAAMGDRVKHSSPTPAQLVVMAYRRRLRDGNSVDFDTILWLGRTLLERHRASLQWQFDAVAVDEAQDSSDAFFAVYDAMPCQRLFLAGDSDQAIMSFMGAGRQFERRCAALETISSQGVTTI